MSDAPSQNVIARARRPIPKAWLDDIEARILRAEAPADFVPTLAKDYGRSQRAVWRYVARVRARLAERAKAHDPAADAEQIRSLLLRAYRTAEKDCDAKGMVSAAKTLADVTGVTDPKKIDHTSNGETIGVVPSDPRWTELQREHLGAARQGVSDEARPDGNADPLASK